MIWPKIEVIVGKEIPNCNKKIMTSCGYDTIVSLKNISLESILRIEEHINERLKNGFIDITQGLDCCHQDFYKKQVKFKFLPGHQEFLLALPNYIHHVNIFNGSMDESSAHSNTHDSARYGVEKKIESSNLIQFIHQHSGFTVIMKELIGTVLRNEFTDKKRTQYSDIIRFFATYIFIMCGRSCYDVLYRNLPIPSISTECK